MSVFVCVRACAVTDETRATRCMVCGAGIQGAQGAQVHAAQTGALRCVLSCVHVSVVWGQFKCSIDPWTLSPNKLTPVPVRRPSKFCGEQVKPWCSSQHKSRVTGISSRLGQLFCGRRTIKTTPQARSCMQEYGMAGLPAGLTLAADDTWACRGAPPAPWPPSGRGWRD